jgi:tellurite resistance protein TerC
MPAELEITAWHWSGFVLAVIVFLGLDLGIFHRKAHVVRFGEALMWTGIWFTLAVAFGFFLASAVVPNWGNEEAIEFITGYIIELSLSMDNVFVIALIFGYFAVPLKFQHRVLFWGILGALLMRGLMIWLGAALIEGFHWMLYVLGGFLLFTGIKMIFSDSDEVEPERNAVIRLTRKFFPVSTHFDGQKFLTNVDGRTALTPLALVLVMVETTDLIFAVDSIPAIFAVTTNSFIVFTSNVFAILGLRSLYFVLAGAIGYFRYLKIGLAIVLSLIGLKMLVAKWYTVPTSLALSVVAGVISISVIASIMVARQEEKREKSSN